MAVNWNVSQICLSIFTKDHAIHLLSPLLEYYCALIFWLHVTAIRKFTDPYAGPFGSSQTGTHFVIQF